MLPSYLSRYVAKEGDNVKIHCPVHGNPKPMIEWYQADRLISHFPASSRFRFSARRSNLLRLRDARTQDSGVIVCKGVNGFGVAQAKIHLVVRGRFYFNKGSFT